MTMRLHVDDTLRMSDAERAEFNAWLDSQHLQGQYIRSADFDTPGQIVAECYALKSGKPYIDPKDPKRAAMCVKTFKLTAPPPASVLAYAR